MITWKGTKDIETAKQHLKTGLHIEFKSVEGGYGKGRTVSTSVFDIDGNELTIKGRNRCSVYISISDLAEYEFKWIEQ
jgi:hypothetical protein